MRKSIYGVLGLAVLLGALLAFGVTKDASAQVQVNIGIAAPPPLQFAAPPDLYVVPSGSSYVYMVPNYDGVYFYNGYWYRLYNGYWFRSSIYNGYWDYIEPSMVPQVIFVVPPEYIHYVPPGYYRIHYRDFYSNWRTWDHKRHWDSYDWYRHERRDDVRRERYSRIERDHKQRGGQTPQNHQGHERQQYDVQKQQGQRQKQYDVQKPPASRPAPPPPHGVQQTTPGPAHTQRKEHQQHDVQKPPASRPAPPPHGVQSAPGPAPAQRVEHQQHDGQKQKHQQEEKEHEGNR